MTDLSMVLSSFLLDVGIVSVILSAGAVGAVLVLGEVVVEIALGEVNEGFSLEIAVPRPALIIVFRALSSCGVSGRIVPITNDWDMVVFSAMWRGTS